MKECTDFRDVKEKERTYSTWLGEGDEKEDGVQDESYFSDIDNQWIVYYSPINYEEKINLRSWQIQFLYDLYEVPAG